MQARISHIFQILCFSLLMSATAFAQEPAVPEIPQITIETDAEIALKVTDCDTGFGGFKGILKKIKKYFAARPTAPAKSSYHFTDVELAQVNEFVSGQSPVQIAPVAENNLGKLQRIASARYANQGLDPQAIQAFGTLDYFSMADREISAEVKISVEGDTLIVDVPHVNVTGALGSVSRGLNVGFSRFVATATKGIEYRLALNPNIKSVKITPSKVVNQKLKVMISSLGFNTTYEAPDYGDISGYRFNLGPLANFEMEFNVTRLPE